MAGGRSCCVVGCSSRSTNDKEKHFYRFPKDDAIREVWIIFTRRGNHFEIKKSSILCQDHFDPSCFVTKKKQVCLTRNAIPTIFFRNTAEGLAEKVQLTFDHHLGHYVEEETLLNPAYDLEKHETDLLAKRDEKLKTMRRLCRFCLEDANEENLIAISKLRDYAINPSEIMSLVGLNTEFDELFGKNACEECFQQIFVFDGYRKRCRKAQDRLLNDMKELDEKIVRVRGDASIAEPWFKTEQPWEEEVVVNDSFIDSPSKKFENETVFQKIIVKEEHLEESAGYSENDYDEFQIHSVENDDTMNEDEKIPGEDETAEGIDAEQPVGGDSEVNVVDPAKKMNEAEDGFDNTGVITQKGTPASGYRVYECFFCRLKFAGKNIFMKHQCAGPNQIKCNVPNCGKLFTKLSGYNSHITNLHRLPKITRLYCDFCKLSRVITADEHDEHRRVCEKNFSQVKDPPVTCDMCGKVCPNAKSFAIHMMFHTTGNKSFNVDEDDPSKPKSKWKKRKRGIFICETCGKEFATKRYLSDHVKRLHTVVKNPQTFICDHCGKTRTTRGAIYKHIKNVHTNDPSPCKFCGKVFRNIALLQAHMIYHKDSKRIHFCPLCPDKPPYVTAVALKRHQESNHGYGNGYRCEICDAVYKTRPGLSQHRITAHGEYAHSSLDRYG